jgi:hypothetical protein
MAIILSLTLSVALPAADLAPAPAPPAAVRTLPDEEFDKRFAEAGTSTAKLWELHLWCKETARKAESKQALEKIVDLEPDHEDARKALGHQRYDGRWFESYTALAKYKREQERRMAERGLVRHGDQWVLEADLPYVRMGWVKDDAGVWASPHVLARRAEEAKLAADGWEQQYLVWVSPAEFDQWRAGLWKCGEEWLPLEKANEYHAELSHWWRIPTDHFIVNSTCDQPVAAAAAGEAERTYADLRRIFGISPAGPIEVTTLRSIVQFNAFANGDPAQNLPAPELAGFSSCHYAFLAEAFLDFSVQPPLYRGQAVAYWDASDEKLAPFGPFAVRHAAGLSYALALDPSLDAISRYVENTDSRPTSETFWEGKQLPPWLHYGAASYVERYLRDQYAEEGNEWWARDWALENLRRYEELLPLEQVFAFQLDITDQEASSRMISHGGLLVSFMLDGGCVPVMEKHGALKAALKQGGDVKGAVEELEQALVGNLEALQAHAGF